MATRRVTPAPTYFATAAAFRAWLVKHSAKRTELIVGFHKVGSGRPCMTWSESVDEALCFGWIDGVRKRIDAQRYVIRFTPRKPDSIWSAINIAKAETLVRQGRMTRAGRDAYARRTEKKSVVYAYEQKGVKALEAGELRAFRRNAPAWKYFEGAPPSYRKVLLHWITTAKRPETRARRLALAIDACASGRRL